jgi:hypothetical protein
MSSLQRFNSVLFAILAPLLIAAVLLVLVTAFREIFPSKTVEPTPPPTDAIISADRAKALTQQGKKANLVTFKELIPLDQKGQLYLIPISQVHLKKPEFVDPNLSSVACTIVEESDYRRYKYGYGFASSSPLNNFVIYDQNTLTSRPLFDYRISIVAYSLFWPSTNVPPILVIAGCTEDTNADGFLDKDDLQDIYRVNIPDFKAEKLTTNSERIVDMNVLAENFVILAVCEDRTAKSRFDADAEPMKLKALDLKTGKLHNIVEPQTVERLQKVLEARSEANKQI